MIKIKEPRALEDRIMRGDDTETLRGQRKGFMSGKACPSKKYSRDSRMEYLRESHREVVKPKEQCVQLMPFLRGWEVLWVRGLWRTSAYGGIVLSGLVMFYGLQMLGEISGGACID